MDSTRAGPWLYTVAHNLIVSGYRRRGVRPAEVSLDGQDFPALTDEIDHAAAGLLLAVLVATGTVSYAGGHRSSAPDVAWSNAVTAPGVSASADLTGQPWGTLVSLHLRDLPPGKLCRLIVRSDDGRTETVGGWTTEYRMAADITASTSARIGDIRRLEVVDMTNDVLVGITQ